jgi:hypothetical protein
VIDLRENSHHITEHLQRTGDHMLKWATVVIKDRCAQEVYELSAKANGSHFSVSHTSVQQLEEFSIDVLSEEMLQHTPVLWDLFEVLLAARRKSSSDLTSSFEDGDCDDEASLWERLGDELDEEMLLIADGSKKHGKMITVQNKIITIVS